MRLFLLPLALCALAYPAMAATVTTPGPVTLVPLDVASVTTGGTAVVAIAAGNRTAGAWLSNPVAAGAPLCISETAVATTTHAGTTTCIAAGTSYVVMPGIGPVSVNSTDSAHAFSGLASKQ